MSETPNRLTFSMSSALKTDTKDRMVPDFKKLMATRFLFIFAVEMQAVLLGWRMYELTHDTLFLGLVGLVEAVPAIGLSLYAGYTVDHSRPLMILRLVMVGALASGLVLFGSQIHDLRLDASSQIAALLISSFLTGVARSFSQPAMYVILPRLVERSQLPHATALMSSFMQYSRILGPGMGGLIFGAVGMTLAAAVVCLALVVSLGFILLMRTQIEPTNVASPFDSTRDELLSGARFVFGHPILLPALSLDMISVLFGGVTGMLPVYASDILHVGPHGLGMLRAAAAVGAGLTSSIVARYGVGRNAGRKLFVCVAGFGICTLVFAVSQNYVLSMAALGLSGAFDSISVIIRSTAVQLASPNELRGRISAVNSIFIGSSNELGELESGVAAKLLGTVPSVLFGGVMCLLTACVVALRFPELRKMDLEKLQAGHAK